MSAHPRDAADVHAQDFTNFLMFNSGAACFKDEKVFEERGNLRNSRQYLFVGI